MAGLTQISERLYSLADTCNAYVLVDGDAALPDEVMGEDGVELRPYQTTVLRNSFQLAMHRRCAEVMRALEPELICPGHGEYLPCAPEDIEAYGDFPPRASSALSPPHTPLLPPVRLRNNLGRRATFGARLLPARTGLRRPRARRRRVRPPPVYRGAAAGTGSRGAPDPRPDPRPRLRAAGGGRSASPAAALEAGADRLGSAVPRARRRRQARRMGRRQRRRGAPHDGRRADVARRVAAGQRGAAVPRRRGAERVARQRAVDRRGRRVADLHHGRRRPQLAARVRQRRPARVLRLHGLLRRRPARPRAERPGRRPVPHRRDGRLGPQLARAPEPTACRTPSRGSSPSPPAARAS